MKTAPDKHSAYHCEKSIDRNKTALLKRIIDAISPGVVADTLTPLRTKKRKLERVLISFQKKALAVGYNMKWNLNCGTVGYWHDHCGWAIGIFPCCWGEFQVAVREVGYHSDYRPGQSSENKEQQ